MSHPRCISAQRVLSVAALLSLLATLVAAGCGGGADDSSGSEATVSAVASTTQVADLLREVGGERVDVHQILQPSSDPHGFEPRPSDVAALTDADVVFRSGGEVDEWVDDLAASAGGDVEVVDLIDSVDTITGEAHEHGEGEHAEEHADHEHAEGGHAEEEHAEDEHEGDETDPHWWHNPLNVVAASDAIAAVLADVDPDGGSDYERRAAAYGDRLRELDREVAACIESIPADRRELVTTHDALGYYVERYGLELVGALIPSLSTAAQPSAGDTQQLVEQIRARDVGAIFPESSLDPELEQAVARETGADVGEPLWADTLGPEGSGGATYVESIRSNTAAIVDGLTRGAERCAPGV